MLAFTPDGQTLVTAPHYFPPGQKRAFARWDVKTGTRAATFDVPGPPRNFLVGHLSGDGRTVYLMNCDPAEPRLGVYDAVTGKERFPNHSQAGAVWGVAFSPDGRWLASAGNDGRVCLWDLERRPAGEFALPARQLEGHTDEVWSVAFSPDGQVLATGGKDETIRLWNVADGQEVHVLDGYSFQAAPPAFSPDGETLAAGSKEGVNLWNVKTGEPKDPVLRPPGPVPAVAFSPDGRWLATAGFIDRTVHLIDRASGQRVHPPFRGMSAVAGLAFSPDSRTLAAVSVAPHPSLRLLDLASKKERPPLVGYTRNVVGVAYHPAGDRVATASLDGTVRLWETAPGADKPRVFDFSQLKVGRCVTVAFTPSGRHLAVGLDNGTIAILRTPPAPAR